MSKKRHIITNKVAYQILMQVLFIFLCSCLFGEPGPSTKTNRTIYQSIKDKLASKGHPYNTERVQNNLDPKPFKLKEPLKSFDETYHLYKISLNTSKPNKQILAAYDVKKNIVYLLPEEIKSLHLPLNISPEKSALLISQCASPADSEITILKSISDIIGYKKSEKVLEKFKETIKAPVMTNQDTLQFFTWQKLGGMLYHWQVKINRKDNRIEEIKKEKLGAWIGDFLFKS